MTPRHAREGVPAFGRRGGPPPWWPANEAWPPPDSRLVASRSRAVSARRRLPVLPGPHAERRRRHDHRAAADRSRDRRDRGRPRSRWRVPLLALVGIALAFVGLMRRVGVPAGDLVGAANRVADGEYSVRVVERGPPFLRSYTRAFNTMVGAAAVAGRAAAAADGRRRARAADAAERHSGTPRGAARRRVSA